MILALSVAGTAFAEGKGKGKGKGKAAPKAKAAATLDGKSFAGTSTEDGKKKGDADTLIFADGKFRSTACDQYGFKPAAYTVKSEGKALVFEATAQSDKEGTNTWKGKVLGDAITGHLVWTKKGQKPIKYTFKGSLKK
jgi:hypothetical protein